MAPSDAEPIALFPIGIVRSPLTAKGDLPRQSGLGVGPSGTIELDSSIPLESLDDLAGFDRIWVITWLDRAAGWRPKVTPPRGEGKRGVFATRAPHRPNPIGLSCVRLVSIEGRTVAIDDHDLLDKTPVLDVKPYRPYSDAHADAAAGWAEDGWIRYRVTIEPGAESAFSWLAPRGVPLAERARRVLALRPMARGGHRVTVAADGLLTWAWRTWRVDYRLDQESRRVMISGVRSGLDPDRDAPIEDRRDTHELHRAFRAL